MISDIHLIYYCYYEVNQKTNFEWEKNWMLIPIPGIEPGPFVLLGYVLVSQVKFTYYPVHALMLRAGDPSH